MPTSLDHKFEHDVGVPVPVFPAPKHLHLRDLQLPHDAVPKISRLRVMHERDDESLLDLLWEITLCAIYDVVQ